MSLVMLYMMSLMLAMVSVPSAMAVNETTQGTVTGTETWSGTMNLQDDVHGRRGFQTHHQRRHHHQHPCRQVHRC